MIDIHCHILDSLDDGPQDMEVSLQMARNAVQDGITKVIATPHCIPEIYFNEKQAVIEKVEVLQERLDDVGIPLRVLPGMEVHLSLDVPQRLISGSALTLGDKGVYVLLELPMNSVPNYAGQVLFEIMLQGIKPVIAHPERNKEIIESPKKLQLLIEKGCLVQVTSGSLTGFFGSSIQQLTEEFIRLGWVDFIASDAHDLRKRPIMLEKARLAAAGLIGEEGAWGLVSGNPERVINGEVIRKKEILPYQFRGIKGKTKKKKSFWLGLSALFKG
ncbi:tyrosine-protein phosphatase [Desulforamulus aeronauticus]|uniref:protein-tyrosine-phosphatase n=1 Tax=Desulforamulus aeronauticus DSM 10349 TaxID=1121421 RepID=A0A1M6V3P9_9FIRM|nr:CpsB/CapC family capsule biosynthesis tyrosine phosphatase [Desulforamulus aeronauticus]SHK76024.1 protein-tyrosine phosphatase [Desulforamulus aeronauticus DSM 10349]